MNTSAYSAFKSQNLVQLPVGASLNVSKRGSLYDPFHSSRIYESSHHLTLHHSLVHAQHDQFQIQQGISVKRAALSFISTIIGAGIVSLPYVILQAGYVAGVAMHLCTIAMLLFAVHLLLTARQNLGFESFGEIAFICLGRPSVFIINFVISAACSFIVVMYALLFSKICVSFAHDAFGDVKREDSVFECLMTSKVTYIFLLFVAMMPNIVKRSIKELKLTSILLFVGVISMLSIFLTKVLFKTSNQPYVSNQQPYVKGGIIDSISIVLTAYGFVLNFYPIFSQLENKTNANGYLSTLLAMIFCFATYLLFSFLALESYGQYLNPNIFENIQIEQNPASYFIRLIFLTIFVCNIPFIFLPGKECLLMMVDEARHRSISSQIKRRIETLQQRNLIHSQDGPSFVQEETNAAKIAERMPAGIYYPQTIGLFILQMLMALLIDDITIIFGFFAAISESTINFIMPGLFYLISHKVVRKRPTFIGVIGSYLYVVIGIGLFFFANYNNYLKLRALE